MTGTPLHELLNRAVAEQRLASEAYKKSERQSRLALQHSRTAERLLAELVETATQLGIEVEIRNA